MAATNPFKVSDLIKKYGWTIMPYLSNLGVRSLAEAQVLFVDSGNTANGADADDGEHGHSFEKPLLTADYATGLCTADEGAIILFAPGHNENLSAAINFDVAGVSYIGLGSGTLRPRFDFDAAASSVNVGANNVTLANLTFMPGYADVLIGVDVEASVTNAHIVDCEFLEGEASGDEFLAAIELKAACHNSVIENNIFRAGWSSNPDDGISLKGASNNVTIRNNRFSGPYGDGGTVTAAISNSAGVCLDLLIENNIMKVKDGESGIEVIATTPAVCRHNTIISTTCTVDDMIVATIGELDQNIGITTDGTSGEFIKGGAISPEVVQYNLDHLAKTSTGIDADDDLSGIVADKTILAHIMTIGADAADFNATTDSLEAIADAVDGIASPTDVTGAISSAPTAKSVQDILSKDGDCNYSKSTDSLEAIRDYIAGTTALDAINLDHLCLTTTGVAAGGELHGHITALSILGHIMASDADPSGFDCQTDSLEAIADAVSALSWATAVSQSPAERSMQDILEKDSTGSFDDATDSLEAISDSLLLAIGDVGTPAAGSALDILKKLYYTADGTDEYPATVANDSTIAKIMAKGATATASTFNNTTDSLEALRDHLDGTTILGGIYLDHLSKTADGADNYPASMTTNSQLAMIMASDGDPTGYNKTTDSLEAIRDHLDGSTVLAGIQLDTLAGVDTTIAIDGDLEVHCVAGSLMAHVLSKTKDATAYKCSTDSLQAISDKLGGYSGDGGAVYDDSVYSAVVKLSTYLADGDGDFATGQALPSNTSLVDIIGDFTGAHDGTDYDDNIFACLKKISTYICDGDGDFAAGAAMPSNKSIYNILGAYTADGGADDEDTIMAHLDLIYADTAAVDALRESSATKTITNLSAASGATNIFTVSGGPVKITSIVGIVANEIKNATINCKLQAQPTAPGNAVDVTAVVDIDTAAVGTTLTPGATFGAALVLTANGVIGDMGFDFVMDDGNIVMNLDANGNADDSIEWYIRYEPLVSGAAIAAAA